jgi:hypothetical protein
MTRDEIVDLEGTARRFWAKVEAEPMSGCLLWLGAVNGRGYGQFYFRSGVRRRYMAAHRVAYMLAGHEIADSHDVCHHCDNRRCVREAHLFDGTRAENLADMAAKGRKARGERVGRAKLTTEDVLAMRASTEAARVLASRHGVSSRTVKRVQCRTAWAHVA